MIPLRQSKPLHIGLLILATSHPWLRAQASFQIDRATASQSVSNDKGSLLNLKEGAMFLVTRVVFAGEPTTIDLRKVALRTAGSVSPVGVDIRCGTADTLPQFNMIASVPTAGGSSVKPIFVSTQIPDVISLRFMDNNNSKSSDLMLKAPVVFCLLFVIPTSPRPGQIVGLGKEPLTVSIIK